MSNYDILGSADDIAQSGINAVNRGALQQLDLSNPQDQQKAASALVGLGHADQITNLADYANKRIATGILQRYANGGGLDYDANGNKVGAQTQQRAAAQSQAVNSDQSPQTSDAPQGQQNIGFHTKVIADANAIKAAGPEGSPQRDQAYQTAVQHYQDLGISPDQIKQELPDSSDASINATIVNHVGHAVHAVNNTGPYAQGGQVSVPQTPDTNTYAATSAVAQDPNANPSDAQSVPASTATVTADVPPADPDTIPNPATGMSNKQARSYLSPEYKNYAAAAKLAGIDVSGNITTAEDTLKPIQDASETRAKNLADTYEATTMNGDKVPFNTRAEYEADAKAHPGYYKTPAPDVQAGRTTLATNLANNQSTGTVDLTYADGHGARTFATKADAMQAVEQNPGLYGDLGPHAKAIAASVTPFSVNVEDSPGVYHVEQATAGEYEQKKANGQNVSPTDYSQAISSVLPGSTITSGYRDAATNSRVGGVDDSHHENGTAIDIVPAKGTSLSEAAAQVKSQFPEVHIIQTKAGTLNANGKPEGAHLHIDWGGPVTAASIAAYQAGKSSGNGGPSASGYGRTPSIQDQNVANADTNQYVEDKTNLTDEQKYRIPLQNSINQGKTTLQLAKQYSVGGGTEALRKIAGVVNIAIPNNEAAARDLLAKGIAQQNKDSISGSGIPLRNEGELNLAGSAAGKENDPKISLLNTLAQGVALNQYRKAYSDFILNDYHGPNSHKSMVTAFENSPQGRLGVWGQDAWNGVTLGGRPIVIKVPNKRTGKIDTIIGAGLDKPIAYYPGQ